MPVDAYHYSNKTAAVDAGLPPPRAGLGAVWAVGVYTATALTDLDTNDCIKLVKIPAGARILDVVVSIAAAGLDTGAGVVWTLGDVDGTDDLDRYITSSTVGQSSGGGVVRMNNAAGAQKTFEADGTIDMTIATGAGTNVATGVITCAVQYTMDP